MRLALLVLALMPACGSDDPVDPGPIPDDAEPCAAPESWPNGVRSADLPLEVRFPDGVSESRARDVLTLLEDDWSTETGAMGFRAPIAVPGCGADGDAFDVFLWPGLEEAYTEGVVEDDATPQDDWGTIIALDPDGDFGGDMLATTLAHELNHACQAADDWDEPIAVLEATATYVELEVVGDEAVRQVVMADFQAHPEWAFDHDDGYETWFMYGGALYLEVLAGDDPAAIGAIWEGMRNAGAGNEPDWADAVTDAVAPRTLDDTFVELAIERWRIEPAPAVVGAASPGVTVVSLGTIDPLGMAYVELTGTGTATLEVQGLGAELAARIIALPDEVEVTDAITLDGTPTTLAIVIVPIAPYDPESPPLPVSLTLALTWA